MAPIYVTALYDYTPEVTDRFELPFKEHDLLEVLSNKGNWWKARHPNGQVGLIPSNYVSIVQQQSREAEEEEEQ